ncbi:hypothetical protein HDU80_003009 [Chytriomyces hyalinus]|nr:hypothetical protein HDU80_003009 [Chytriomyces hyalinus]
MPFNFTSLVSSSGPIQAGPRSSFAEKPNNALLVRTNHPLKQKGVKHTRKRKQSDFLSRIATVPDAVPLAFDEPARIAALSATEVQKFRQENGNQLQENLRRVSEAQAVYSLSSLAVSLAKRRLESYIRLNANAFDYENVKQIILMTTKEEKYKRLADLLKESADYEKAKITVFVNTPEAVDPCISFLQQAGFAADGGERFCRNGISSELSSIATHGKENKAPIITVTAGLSTENYLENATFACNLDVPNPVTYSSRIQQMSHKNSNSEKLFYTFFTKDDAEFARPLADILDYVRQEIPTALSQMAGTSEMFAEDDGYMDLKVF